MRPHGVSFEGGASTGTWSTAVPYDVLVDDEHVERQEDRDDPRDEPPPVIYGEEIEGGCAPLFVRGIGETECDPRGYDLSSTCNGTITGFIFPGSRWERRVGDAIAEINRAFEFYARVCVHLRLDQLRLSRTNLRMLRAWYRQWHPRVVQAVGGAGHLGTTTIPTDLVDEFRGAMADLHVHAHDAGARLLVIFMDEYITDHRPSLGSGCRRDRQQIGIDWVDHGSHYILAHELVHAFGKPEPGTPGAVTWSHDSICQNALTTVARTMETRRDPIDLSNRFLDLAEYNEIVANLGAGVLARENGGCSA